MNIINPLQSHDTASKHCKEVGQFLLPLTLKDNEGQNPTTSSQVCEKSEKRLFSSNSQNPMAIPAPELSDLALYGPLGRIIQKISPHTEAHPAAILVQLVIALGNSLGRRGYVVIDDSAHYSNLFGILAGDSSTGRKGTAWGKALKIMEKIDPVWVKNHTSSGLGSGEGMIVQLADTGDPKIDTNPDLKRLLIMEEEFSQLLQVMKRSGGILSTTIRTAWNTSTLRISTRNKPVLASNCHISFICHVTRRELRKSLSETDRGNGFANRFLWCHSARTKKLPFPISIDELGIDDDIEKLRRATMLVQLLDPFEIFLTDEAKQYYGDIYGKLSDSHEGLWGEVTDRSVTQIVRIALVYCLLDGDTVIEYKHILAAEHLWDYCDQSARWAFEQNQYSEKALRIITALDHGPMSLSEIHKLFSGRLHKWDLGDTLNEISHLIKVTTEPTTGRDKTIISLIDDIIL